MNADPIKITFFLASLEGGGIQRATMRLIEELIRQGIPTSLVVVNGSGPIRKAVPQGCTFSDLGHKRTRFAPVSMLLYLIKNKPEIGISSQAFLNFLMIFLRSLTGYPKYLIVREHNTLTTEGIENEGRAKMILVRLIRLLYPSASEVVAVSQSVKASLREHAGYHGPIRVIRNGVNLSELHQLSSRAPDPPALELNPGERLVVGMGRLSHQKNFQLLIEAFSHLSKQMDVRLIIMGEGSERESISTLAQNLGVADRVDMPGFIENPYPILARADLFVLSSRWEGFGNVVIEALACGVPIVSTDCPGGPANILHDQPFARIVPADQPRAMAEAAAAVVTANFDRAGIIRFADQFSIETIARQYLELVDEVRGSG